MNPDSDRVRALIAGNQNMRSEGEQAAAKALHHLRVALDHACTAQAPRTVARIRLAISSAKGAVRAAGYRAQRQAEGGDDRPTNP